MPATAPQTIPTAMPAATEAWIIGYVSYSKRKPTARRLRGALILRWILWSENISANIIPGYDVCPPEDRTTGAPAGWTLKHFRALILAASKA